MSDDFFLKDQGIPGTGSAPALNTRIENNRNISQLQYRTESMGWDRLQTTWRIFNVYEDSRYKDPHGEMGTGQQNDEYLTNVIGLDFLANIFWPDFQVVNLKLA